MHAHTLKAMKESHMQYKKLKTMSNNAQTKQKKKKINGFIIASEKYFRVHFFSIIISQKGCRIPFFVFIRHFCGNPNSLITIIFTFSKYNTTITYFNQSPYLIHAV